MLISTPDRQLPGDAPPLAVGLRAVMSVMITRTSITFYPLQKNTRRGIPFSLTNHTDIAKLSLAGSLTACCEPLSVVF